MKKYDDNNAKEESNNDYKSVFLKGKKERIIAARDTHNKAYWKGYIGNERYAILNDFLKIVGE